MFAVCQRTSFAPLAESECKGRNFLNNGKTFQRFFLKKQKKREKRGRKTEGNRKNGKKTKERKEKEERRKEEGSMMYNNGKTEILKKNANEKSTKKKIKDALQEPLRTSVFRAYINI